MASLLAKFRQLFAPSRPGEIGNTGPVYGTLGPPDRDPRLSGSTRYRTYRDFQREVEVITLSRRFYSLLITGAKWSFNGANSRDAERLLDELETSWPTIVDRALDYWFFGFSVQEMIAEPGRGVVDLAPRPQETIKRIDPDAFVQYGRDYQDVSIPKGKCLWLADISPDGDPWGEGVYRGCARAAFRIQQLQALEMIDLVNSLQGVPIGRWPGSALTKAAVDDTEKAKVDALRSGFETVLRNRSRKADQFFLLDSDLYENTGADGHLMVQNVPKWDIEFSKDLAGPLEQTDAALRRYESRIAQIMSVEQVLIGGESAGSYALSSDKTTTTQALADSMLRAIKDAVEQQLLRMHWTLLGRNPDRIPEAEIEPLGFRSVKEITEALRDIKQSDLTRDDEAYVELYEMLGLTPPSPDDAPEPELPPGFGQPEDEEEQEPPPNG